MFQIVFTNGTICMAIRVLAVMSPHDDAGDKTYYVAQIDNAKRRIPVADVAEIAMVV
jgi:hypothetical protein